MNASPFGDRRPISVQLVELIRQMIAEEGMRPGDRLPSESEMAERFGLGRSSVREALKLLEQDGVIYVRHGLGRFVSPIGGLEVDRPITKHESTTEMLSSRGFLYSTTVLSVDVRAPTDEEAQALGVLPGAEIVQLRRVRHRRRRLLVYSISMFPADLVDTEGLDSDWFEGSLSAWLAERGAAPVSSAAQIRATSLPSEVEPLDPSDSEVEWLLLIERCVSSTGSPVLYSLDYHRGDVFSFHVLRR
jgi:GntR family transcriptional regulator